MNIKNCIISSYLYFFPLALSLNTPSSVKEVYGRTASPLLPFYGRSPSKHVASDRINDIVRIVYALTFLHRVPSTTSQLARIPVAAGASSHWYFVPGRIWFQFSCGYCGYCCGYWVLLWILKWVLGIAVDIAVSIEVGIKMGIAVGIKVDIAVGIAVTLGNRATRI